MKAEFENIELVKNEEQSRFEMKYNGHKGLVNFGYFGGGNYALVHTEVEPEIQGSGAAGALVEKVLNKISDEGKKIRPYCPYIFSYIKKHPEYKRLVDENFDGYNEL